MSLSQLELEGFRQICEGVYEWREVSVVEVSGGYCSCYSECGLCDCEGEVVVEVTSERPRYSRSRRGYVLEVEVERLCQSHLDGLQVECYCR